MMKKHLKFIIIFIAIIAAGFILLNFRNNELDDVALDDVVKDGSRISALPETAEILFTSDRDTGGRRHEIYAMDSDGGNQTRITFTKEHHGITGIDSSRKHIVISRAEKDTDKPSGLSDEDKKALWIINLETKEEKRLTDIRNKAEGDSFSPDGEWIVFMMTIKGEDQPDIYKIKKDGSDLTKLTDTKTGLEGDPEFSPDGKEIAFAYLDGLDKNPRFLIKTMDINGGNIKTVYDGGDGLQIGPFPPGNYDPSWSPDGEWIVFERAVEDTGGNWGSGIWHIFKVKKDGRQIIDLSLSGKHADRAEYLPSFSADGNWIIFGSLYEAKNPQESHGDIFKISSEIGDDLKRLTTNPTSEMFPVWIK